MGGEQNSGGRRRRGEERLPPFPFGTIRDTSTFLAPPTAVARAGARPS